MPEATEPPSAVELVLASLIEATHKLAPDEVVPTVAAHFAALGAPGSRSPARPSRGVAPAG